MWTYQMIDLQRIYQIYLNIYVNATTFQNIIYYFRNALVPYAVCIL